MITRRPSGERGHADHGWLDTRHTFSFAGYHDPRYAGFRDLLVINEHRVQPSRGFGAHSHAAMDGRDGAVAIHQDAEVFASRLGTGTEVAHKLRPGRYAWIQVIEGDVDVNGGALSTGDGAAVSDEAELRVRA